MFEHLFSPFDLGGLRLKNRLTMAPLFTGYAGEAGVVNAVLLEHYRMMAAGGVAMVVVENASIDYPAASGSLRQLRADTDESVAGLARLAEAIHAEGAIPALQIHHGGRYAKAAPEPVAPSALEFAGRTPRALKASELPGIADKFAQAGRRAKEAGFDLVELHGGTGYLLSEFISRRTNLRTDEYGGSLENRCRFPLEVIAAVRAAVGDMPVGYRFLADEWLPGGLTLEESAPAARMLAAAGLAYLSVMGGCHESYRLPEVVEAGEIPGYMAYLAEGVKRAVDIPVIAAGRIDSGALAEEILGEGKADLIGLARVLWADPEWPQKVREGREDEIIHCDCQDACNKQIVQGKPLLCARWPRDKHQAWQDKVG